MATARGPKSGLRLGLFYAGPGLGIAASGMAVPAWFSAGGAWPGAWLSLAAVSAAMTIPLGLSLYGRRGGARMAAGASARAPLRRMAPILLAYAVFGLAYIGYMSFAFAWGKEARGVGVGQAGFCVLIGGRDGGAVALGPASRASCAGARFRGADRALQRGRGVAAGGGGPAR